MGAAAGYLGGNADSVLMRLVDIVLTIPMLVLGMALATIVGPSVINIVLIIALLAWPATSRLVRGSFLSIRDRDYVRAAVATGSSSWWIVFREIMPNVVPVIIVAWSFEVGSAIIIEAGLSFLGLGINEPTPSLGRMVADSRQSIQLYWHLGVFPTLAIALCVLGFAFMGDGLRDALDPRQN